MTPEERRVAAEQHYQESLQRLTALAQQRQQYTNQMYQQSQQEMQRQDQIGQQQWGDDALMGAGSGAMIGSMFLPGAGTAIGAIAGGLLGGGIGAYKSYKSYKQQGSKDPWADTFTFQGDSLSPELMFQSAAPAAMMYAQHQRSQQPVSSTNPGGNTYNTHAEIEGALGNPYYRPPPGPAAPPPAPTLPGYNNEQPFNPYPTPPDR